MRSKRPNLWLGLALFFVHVPRAHAVPAKEGPRASAPAGLNPPSSGNAPTAGNAGSGGKATGSAAASGKDAPKDAPSKSVASGTAPGAKSTPPREAPAPRETAPTGAMKSSAANAPTSGLPSATKGSAPNAGNGGSTAAKPGVSATAGPIPKGAADSKSTPEKSGVERGAADSKSSVEKGAVEKSSVESKSSVEAKEAKGAADAKAKPRPATPSRAKTPSPEPRRASPWGDAESESPELRALRDADRELFRAGSVGASNGAWPNDFPGPLLDPSKPLVRSTGIAPPSLFPDGSGDAPRDLSWLQSLALSDMPARWDARVVRYLSYYHDEARGRSLLQGWVKKSGRYGATIRRVFRDRGLPDDLVWVALIESGFEPSIRSPAGACGLWQFMPDGARAFGLAVDRVIDERYDAERATEAAARYLADLHRRLGNWELALAAYNMGYGALLNAIRKYNTNDFWELTKYEAGVPYETALYVPKIIAVGIAARNPAQFALDSVKIDPPIAFDPVVIPGGTTVQAIANAAGVPVATIEQLNPQLRKGKTPPITQASEIRAWTVRVPQGKGIAVSKKFAPRMGRERDVEPEEPATEDTALAAGESNLPEPDPKRPDDPAGHLVGFAPNALPSSTAMLPPVATIAPPPAAAPAAAEKSKIAPPVSTDEKPVVVHPVEAPRFPGRSRIFYRIAAGDTVRDLAARFGVTSDDLARWNPLDLSARLQEGMTLQVFVKDGADFSKVEHLAESDVRCLQAGSDEFFAHFEALRGRKRTTITIEEGDTWERLGKRYNLTLGQLERINQRSRFDKLAAKETIVVYAPINKNVAHQADVAMRAPAALGPVVAPNPEDLPNLPDVPDMETSDNDPDLGFGGTASSRRLTP